MPDHPDETEYRPQRSNGGAEGSPPAGNGRKPASMNLEDRQLGDFRILRRLGRGGMAEVYLAEQVSLKRQVAIKVLLADMLDEKDTVLIRRFEQEASAAGGLSHPNIVQVYMVGADEGIHYIAQEYVQGPNLKDYIRKKGPLELNAALRVIRQTAAALQAASEAGIVHRDIKPENIMLTRKGEVKVADFGLAQLSTNKEGVNLTQVGMTMGTPLYMSPEQINGRKVDHRSDIYSFGVTSYFLLTGRPPFEGETPLNIAVKHLNEEPPRLSQFRRDLPPAVVDLVHRMFAKSPEKRIQTAAEIQQEVKRIQKLLRDDPEHSQLIPERDAPSEARRPSWLPQDFGKQVAVFLGCAALVFGAASAEGWLMRTSDPRLVPARKEPSTIKREETAQAQYIRASKYGTAVEWGAVIEYFPADPNVTYRAKVQLALACLREGMRPRAEEIFGEFEASSSNNKTYEEIAKAGRAILACWDGEHEKSSKIIAEIDRARIDGDLREEINRLEELNLERLRAAQQRRTVESLDVQNGS